MLEDVQNRRKERRRKIRRRRLFISLIFFIIIAIITLAIMCFTLFFPIKSIGAKGSKLYTSEQIVAASGIDVGDKLFAVSKKTVENSIRKSLPYVDAVTIKREFPDGIKLTVKDAEEYVCYNVDGKYYVVSKKGYVLSENGEKPENIFEIICGGVGCEIGAQVTFEDEEAQELIDTLTDAFSKQDISIDEIDITNTIQIKAKVENRFDVYFGTHENIDKKIAHLSGMIESIGDRSGSIDLSMWTEKKSQGSFVETKVVEEK